MPVQAGGDSMKVTGRVAARMAVLGRVNELLVSFVEQVLSAGLFCWTRGQIRAEPFEAALSTGGRRASPGGLKMPSSASC